MSPACQISSAFLHRPTCAHPDDRGYQKAIKFFSLTYAFSNVITMQYTAKTPHDSVLILQADGLRYRYQEDHVFKDIRYGQITEVKIKRNLFQFYFWFISPL